MPPLVGTQVPSSQVKPFAHCASPSHVVRQPFASHAYGEHAVDGPALQAPSPSHVDAAVNVDPAHVGSAQRVLSPA